MTQGCALEGDSAAGARAGSRPVILTFIGRYLPGYKAGGAIRTVANMTEALSDEFRFMIVTSDRDSGDLVPYPSIQPRAWQTVGKADVLYLAPEEITVGRFKELIKTTPHDVVYLQSCFSTFTVKPLLAVSRAAGRKQTPVIVAPRGELYPGALSIRRMKKIAYLRLSRVAGFYSKAVWQASSAEEAGLIRRWFGGGVQVRVAPDVAYGDDAAGSIPTGAPKRPGQARIVFLSRICPKKNLAGALDAVRSVRGDAVFDIFGPAEDAEYWQTCQRLMQAAPSNVTVRYRGTVPHEDVSRVLAEYDLFLFPTLGENFGHVILEALLAGCPVLISDQTPWRGLETAGAGWDLPLSEPQAFTNAVQECLDMDEAAHSAMRAQAREMGARYANSDDILDANRQLFLSSIGKR